jgi:hypothetical protein
MGGKLVVLMHDFRQLLPVVKHGSRGDSLCLCNIQQSVATLHNTTAEH